MGVNLAFFPVTTSSVRGLKSTKTRFVFGWNSTFFEFLDKSLWSGTETESLNQMAIVLLRAEKNTVNQVTIVGTDTNERNLVVATPIRDPQGHVSFFIRGKWEATKNGSQLWNEVVLEIPARADCGCALEALFLGVLCHFGFFCIVLEWTQSPNELQLLTVKGAIRNGAIGNFFGGLEATVDKDLDSSIKGSVNNDLA
jgi:hypothetical protein